MASHRDLLGVMTSRRWWLVKSREWWLPTHDDYYRDHEKLLHIYHEMEKEVKSDIVNLRTQLEKWKRVEKVMGS